MDMTFWNHVLALRAERERKARLEKEARISLMVTGIISAICLVATYVATM